MHFNAVRLPTEKSYVISLRKIMRIFHFNIYYENWRATFGYFCDISIKNTFLRQELRI